MITAINIKRLNKILYNLVLCTSILTGCTKQQDQKLTESIESARPAPTPEHNDKAPVEEKIEFEDQLPDSIARDSIWIPHNADHYMATILEPGQFHGDEVWQDADKEEWFGVFRNNGSYYLAKTKIQTKKVQDEVIDADGEMTGWEVKVQNSDTVIVLIAGLDFLSEHQIEQVTLSKTEILPDDTLQFNYLGADYKLFATGIKKKALSDSDWYNVWNYKLYLTTDKNGGTITELLVARPVFDGRMINIIFAGDIDGDSILDLLIDTASHYNAISPTLYLSKPAGDQHLLKITAMHTQVGC